MAGPPKQACTCTAYPTKKTQEVWYGITNNHMSFIPTPYYGFSNCSILYQETLGAHTYVHTRTRITGLKLYNTYTPLAIVTYVHTYVSTSHFELDFKFLAFANASAC